MECFFCEKYHLIRENRDYKEGMKITVTSLLWSIWLVRNDFIFSEKRVKKEVFQFIVKSSALKWMEAIGLSDQEKKVLMEINPSGALSFFMHPKMSSFLQKLLAKEWICFCDGSFKIEHNGNTHACIGGLIKKDDNSNIYLFSGPCNAQSAVQAEFFALQHLC